MSSARFPELPYRLWSPPVNRRLAGRVLDLSVDPACAADGSVDTQANGQVEPSSFLEVDHDRIRGCVVDVTMDHGPLYEPSSPNGLENNDVVRLRYRPVEIPLPSPSALPTGPAEIMDNLLRRATAITNGEPAVDPRKTPADEHARPYHDVPMLSHGRSFLDLRGRIARALFAHPAYREWVMGRLDREAGERLSELLARYHALAPDLSAEALEQVVRETPDGQRILARAERPSDPDLQHFLAAWLGDISAYDLFVGWEIAQINAYLQHSSGQGSLDTVAERWRELRRVLAAPSYARVLTLLIPTYDPLREVIGFWRIVLPRPSWRSPRATLYRRSRKLSGPPSDVSTTRPSGPIATASPCIS